jgi:hypothetical protein
MPVDSVILFHSSTSYFLYFQRFYDFVSFINFLFLVFPTIAIWFSFVLRRHSNVTNRTSPSVRQVRNMRLPGAPPPVPPPTRPPCWDFFSVMGFLTAADRPPPTTVGPPPAGIFFCYGIPNCHRFCHSVKTQNVMCDTQTDTHHVCFYIYTSVNPVHNAPVELPPARSFPAHAPTRPSPAPCWPPTCWDFILFCYGILNCCRFCLVLKHRTSCDTHTDTTVAFIYTTIYI